MVMSLNLILAHLMLMPMLIFKSKIHPINFNSVAWDGFKILIKLLVFK